MRFLSFVALALVFMCALHRDVRADDASDTKDKEHDHQLDTQADPELPPLLSVEIRSGLGIVYGGGAGRSVARRSPYTFHIFGEYGIEDAPWTTLYGGLLLETGRRATAGGIVGVRLYPGAKGFRLSLGAAGVILPNTAFGPIASVGKCFGKKIIGCMDVESTAYVFGDDLADDRLAFQVQAVLGVRFAVH